MAGRSHAATATPCQDYVATRSTRGMACMALADGAGSRQHSASGAEASVKAALRLLSRDFDALHDLSQSDSAQVANKVLDACLGALGRKARTLQTGVEQLACTLMFVAHKGDRYLMGHLGDGAIMLETAPGQMEVLSHPQNGEYVNTTFFVTDRDAHMHLRIAAGVHATPSFALMSDGTAESLYLRANGQAAPALHKLFQWNRDLSRVRMEGVLSANLEQAFGRRTSDDCAIGLLSALPVTPLSVAASLTAARE